MRQFTHFRNHWRRLLLVSAVTFFGSSSLVQSAEIACGEQASDLSRIVVAGGSLTEILFSLGRSASIVAVDSTSNFPEAAASLPQIGYVRNLSAEGLLSLKPSFVLGEHDMGPPEVVKQLQALNVDLLIVPERFDADGISDKIRCVAAAVGESNAGERLVAELLAGVTDAGEASPGAAKGIVLLGLRAGTPVAAGANTSGDGLLTMAGAENLFDFDGWKPVSMEAMAAAQPEFIVIPHRGIDMAGGLDELLAHPALRLTPAAKTRRVIAMDGMAMLGFGPRTVMAASSLRNSLLQATALSADSGGSE